MAPSVEPGAINMGPPAGTGISIFRFDRVRVDFVMHAA
jgi:hypothetical protein